MRHTLGERDARGWFDIMRVKRDPYTAPEPHTNEYMLLQFLRLEFPMVKGVKKDYPGPNGIRYEFAYEYRLGGEALERFGSLLGEANIGNEFILIPNKDKILFVFNLSKKYSLVHIIKTTMKHRLARKQPILDMEFVRHG